MEQVYPLQEEIVSRYCGLPVCVIMKDGSRYIGRLSACRGGTLMLNGDDEDEQPQQEPQADVMKAKGKKSTKKSGSLAAKKAPAKPPAEPEAHTQSYPFDPYYYGPPRRPFFPFGGALALDFALIAFLFLLV